MKKPGKFQIFIIAGFFVLTLIFSEFNFESILTILISILGPLIILKITGTSKKIISFAFLFTYSVILGFFQGIIFYKPNPMTGFGGGAAVIGVIEIFILINFIWSFINYKAYSQINEGKKDLS